MIRSIELILGLPPLSQYDAAARPMFESFTDTPDLKPYTHEPARVDLNAEFEGGLRGGALVYDGFHGLRSRGRFRAE